MEKLGLSINSKIEVLYDKTYYKSIIQDIDYENENILISIPVVDGNYLTLNEGEAIEQIFYDSKGNVYKYKTKIIKRVKERNIPFYMVGFPHNIEKIQRRDYVRVNSTQNIEYKLEEKTKKYDLDKSSYEKGLLIDISGGGMRFKGSKELSYGNIISVNIKYQDQSIEAKGKIVRVEKTEDKKFIYGVSFKDISNATREKIIRVVFTIMRKQRELL